MMEALTGPLQAAGYELEDIDWREPGVAWSDFGAVMIGTTWDYWDHKDAFLDTLRAIETKTRLFNPAHLVEWNAHKSYLKQLEAKGARLIPTLWMDEVTPNNARAAFDRLGRDDLVFKRQVGAGADGQHRLKRGEAIPDMPHPMMVQPFLSRIVEKGEFSFIFIDGVFSHALIKRAASGDYRIQSSYGGTEEKIEPDREDLRAATAMIETLDAPPLDARVDMLRAETGELLLMELELIEPYLYPQQGPDLGPLIAKALTRRLGR